MLSLDEYQKQDAIALANLVRDRLVSPGELLSRALLRLHEVNPRLNAECGGFTTIQTNLSICGPIETSARSGRCACRLGLQTTRTLDPHAA